MSIATITDLERDGYTLLSGVFTPDEVERMRSALEAALSAGADPAIRGDEGAVYAARNVLTLWPAVAEVWKKKRLAQTLRAVLGPDLGLVRVLYFDKPPGHSWALPWHKDMTVAVRDNTRSTTHFRKPTTKAGVPHVEAPMALLERM